MTAFTKSTSDPNSVISDKEKKHRRGKKVENIRVVHTEVDSLVKQLRNSISLGSGIIILDLCKTEATLALTWSTWLQIRQRNLAEFMLCVSL